MVYNSILGQAALAASSVPGGFAAAPAIASSVPGGFAAGSTRRLMSTCKVTTFRTKKEEKKCFSQPSPCDFRKKH